MALKRQVHEICERCGQQAAEQLPDGTVRTTNHRCTNPVPGPPPVPMRYRPGEVIFVPRSTEG